MWRIEVGKQTKASSQAQIGAIVFGNGLSKEAAILEAQTRPGVTEFVVEEDHITLHGRLVQHGEQIQPAPKKVKPPQQQPAQAS